VFKVLYPNTHYAMSEFKRLTTKNEALLGVTVHISLSSGGLLLGTEKCSDEWLRPYQILNAGDVARISDFVCPGIVH